MSDSKTATERLRELLDERGVEYQKDDTDTLLHTVWENQNGQLCTHFEAIGEAAESWIDEVSLYRPTPEQAVAATLGNAERTCNVESTLRWDSYHGEEFYEHKLSCGHVVTTDYSEPPYYCGECGAKVVGE